MISVVVEPLAQRDLMEARDWYEMQKPGLGEGFLHAVQRTLERIEAFPEAYPEVDSGVRFAIPVPYPYKLLYWLTDTSAHVIAVMHSAREPNTWRGRLNRKDE